MTDKTASWPNRKFQIWRYVVSHRQLLLRSPKSESASTRVDVLFKDVSFMCLSADLSGLSIQEADVELRETLQTIPTISKCHMLLILQAAPILQYVVAAAYISSEDDKEYYDPSALIAEGHL